jgi:hypothetical protein
VRIPRKFIHEGEFWKVRYKKNLTFRGKPQDGLCDPKTKTVWIRAEMGKARRWQTFVHEYLHVTLHMKELGLNAGRMDGDHEEQIVCAIEERLQGDFNISWKWKRK